MRSDFFLSRNSFFFLLFRPSAFFIFLFMILCQRELDRIMIIRSFLEFFFSLSLCFRKGEGCHRCMSFCVVFSLLYSIYRHFSILPYRSDELKIAREINITSGHRAIYNIYIYIYMDGLEGLTLRGRISSRSIRKQIRDMKKKKKEKRKKRGGRKNRAELCSSGGKKPSHGFSAYIFDRTACSTAETHSIWHKRYQRPALPPRNSSFTPRFHDLI